MLPEFFIRMLTEEGDFVIDPFAGSCVTGEVSERLKRKWVCCDKDREYLLGAIGRFSDIEEEEKKLKRAKKQKYEISPPSFETYSEEKKEILSKQKQFGLNLDNDV